MGISMLFSVIGDRDIFEGILQKIGISIMLISLTVMGFLAILTGIFGY